MTSNNAMIAAISFSYLARVFRAPALVSLVALLIGPLLGCSAGSGIREAELAITPTEPASSFSRTSQAHIAALNLAPDTLAAPEPLEQAESLESLGQVDRSLLLSEAWFLRGQNDIDVPISTSLNRFLRAAHHAYEGIFSGPSCDSADSQLCSDLFGAYNRASREVGRLTQNGLQLPEPKENAYILDLEADQDALPLTEWDLQLNEKASGSSHALGASGSACQTLATDTQGERSTVRVCAPIAFLVTFDARASEPHSRVHIAAYKSSPKRELHLHSKLVSLSNEQRATWDSIIPFATSPEGSTTCLAEVEPLLPTVFFLLPPYQESSEWPAIAATLSSEPRLIEHFNFCVLKTPGDDNAVALSESVTVPLSALSSTAAKTLNVIMIAQGNSNDQFVRSLKQSLKTKDRSAALPLSVVGSLTVPDPPASGSALGLPTGDGDLSKSALAALNDSKRLLTKLSDGDEAVLGAYKRGSLPSQPGMTISPVM